MSKTKSGLVAASIGLADGEGVWLSLTSNKVSCMFNPFEYSVSKSNSFQRSGAKSTVVADAQFSSAGPQKLSLNLFFDTYEDGKDVSETTNTLWRFMEPNPVTAGKEANSASPPKVVFEWGSFSFKAYITQMTQKFTLFNHKGIPVRAEVSLSFEQYADVFDYRRLMQNPTSGNGPAQHRWVVGQGDRIDGIAKQALGKATRWREIADYNRLTDVRNLQPGEVLLLPDR